MQKIPVRQASEPEPTPSTPTYVVEALEQLLLGGIWWFVLILVPILRRPELMQGAVDVARLLVKVQGLATAAIALVLVLLRFVGAARQAHWQRELMLLVMLGSMGGLLVWLGTQPAAIAANQIYALALQGILALGYFLSRRGSEPSL